MEPFNKDDRPPPLNGGFDMIATINYALGLSERISIENGHLLNVTLPSGMIYLKEIGFSSDL